MVDRGLLDILETWNLKCSTFMQPGTSSKCVRNHQSSKDPTWRWWIGAFLMAFLTSWNLKCSTSRLPGTFSKCVRNHKSSKDWWKTFEKQLKSKYLPEITDWLQFKSYEYKAHMSMLKKYKLQVLSVINYIMLYKYRSKLPKLLVDFFISEL